MYDELIKRLRDWPKICAQYDGSVDQLHDEAADAIEELIRKEKFHAFLWNTIQPNEMEAYLSMYNAGNEKEES